MSRKRKPIKRNMRRRGPGIVLTLFCMTVILVAILAAMTIFFKVKSIEVKGETRYKTQDIIAALNIKENENMFLVNKFAAIDRLFVACPYLDEIVMRRKLPDKLEITVTEAQPVMHIGLNGVQYITDIKGKILEAVEATGDTDVCKIEGADLFEPIVGKKISFLQKEKENPLFNILNIAKNNDILNDINKIDISKIYEIKIDFNQGYSVLLGTVEDLEHKIRVLNKVLEELGSTKQGIIDVTDPGKVYFRPYSLK